MTETTKRRIESIKRVGQSGIGKQSLLQYLKGKQLHRKKSIEAKCYECMGYYADGRVDCLIPDCPLYPYNPYSKDFRGDDGE